MVKHCTLFFFTIGHLTDYNHVIGAALKTTWNLSECVVTSLPLLDELEATFQRLFSIFSKSMHVIEAIGNYTAGYHVARQDRNSVGYDGRQQTIRFDRGIITMLYC